MLLVIWVCYWKAILCLQLFWGRKNCVPRFNLSDLGCRICVSRCLALFLGWKKTRKREKRKEKGKRERREGEKEGKGKKEEEGKKRRRRGKRKSRRKRGKEVEIRRERFCFEIELWKMCF